MQSLLQILKVNEKRSGEKNGRKWEMQDCECILLTDAGEPDQVGVLMLPKDLVGNVTPGRYTGAFALKADLMTKRIEARLTSLVAVPRPAKS